MAYESASFDTSALQEVLFDDIGDLGIDNGIFRCNLYAWRRVPHERDRVLIPVLSVALPVNAVTLCTAKALALIASEAVRIKKGDGAAEAVAD